MIKKILAAAALGAVAMGAQASANLVSNGSFESASFGGDYCYGSACGIADWTVASAVNPGAWQGPVLISSGSPAWGNPGTLKGSIDLGNYIVGLQDTSTDIAGGVTSSLSSSFAVVAGQSYKLTWDDAGRNYGGDHSYDVSVGGVDLGTYSTAKGQAWGEHQIAFTATTTGALTFTGVAGVANNYDGTSFLDNVAVSVVPEPTALLMMAFGTLGLLAWRRRAQV